MISKDVINHNYFSSFIAMIIFLVWLFSLQVIDTSINRVLSAVSGIAFNFAIILLGIGINRLGKEIENIKQTDSIKYAYSCSYLLIIASILDISEALLFLFLEDIWMNLSMKILSLSFVMISYILIIIGFLFLKEFYDYLFEIEIVHMKNHSYLIVGFLLFMINDLLSWINDLLNNQIRNVGAWVDQILFVSILIATFFIILGFFNLTFTNRSMKEERQEIIEGVQDE